MRELKFTFAYQFVARIAEMVASPKGEDYIEDYFKPTNPEFRSRIAVPNKATILHDFISVANYNDWEWYVGHADIEHVIKELSDMCHDANIDIPSWLTETDFGVHKMEAYELLEKTTNQISDPAFHILFSDHEFLFRFQTIVASVVKKMKREDYPGTLEKDGVLKRLPYIPQWLRNAIFYRDKGHCQICRKDLTGLLTPQYDRELQYDHIIPLNESGTNDPTNFQLACEHCNTSKQDTVIFSVPVTFTYW